MPPKKVVIIGGGPAALTAAIYLRRGGVAATILEKEALGGQIADCPKVDNYPACPSISGLELADKMANQAMELGAEIELDEALSLQKEGGLFSVKGNYGTYTADAVIIANGAKHAHLGVPGEDRLSGRGVSYCAVCDGAFFKDQETVVIGDGNSALQYAILLSSLCKKVTVLTLFDRFFGEESLAKTLSSLQNVEVIHNASTTEFVGENKLEKVLYLDKVSGEKKEVPCQGAFIAIGQKPDNDRFLPLVELDKGYIVTDETMATLTPGLYAAGDTRVKKIRQVVTADSDGAIAALSALSYLKNQS